MWQVNPYDPNSILACQYTNLVTGHYHMRRQYRIVRPAGTHDWLIKFTISGRGLIRHADGKFTLKPGQMAAFKPEMPHDYGTDPQVGHWEMLWVHFHPLSHWLPLLDWTEPARGLLLLDIPRRTAEGRRVVEQFHEMHRLATSNSPRRDWLAMNALEGLLLRCDTLVSRAKTDLDPRLENVTEYIHRTLKTPSRSTTWPGPRTFPSRSSRRSSGASCASRPSNTLKGAAWNSRCGCCSSPT